MTAFRSQTEILDCRRCDRLVQYREQVSREKVRRFREWDYWGRPVPSLGNRNARLLVIGLAPAAHGGNRTGRVFTGDRSGDWLFRAMHRAGFANQPQSTDAGDGLHLIDSYITAAVHCAPPDNKPLPEEYINCRPYLLDEMQQLSKVRVIIPLGGIAFRSYLAARKLLGWTIPQPLPSFGHGAETAFDHKVLMVCSYHPSQQNTQTGRLTETMLDDVFQRAQQWILQQSMR